MLLTMVLCFLKVLWELGRERRMFRFYMGDLMIYACIHDYVLCLFCCLGLLDSFGPL